MSPVLLISKNPWLVSLLTGDLAQDEFDVRGISDEVRGIAEVIAGNCEIVVLDAAMANPGGFDILLRIRRKSAVPALILTGSDADMALVAELGLGANDRVAKPCSRRELAAHLRTILRRKRVAAPGRSPRVLASGSLTMWPSQRRAEWAGEHLPLTRTEFSLLAILLRHAGLPVTKLDLSMHALGRDLGPHDRSIDMHLSRIRKKLGRLPNGHSPIQAADRNTYQLIDNPAPCNGCPMFLLTCASSRFMRRSEPSS